MNIWENIMNLRQVIPIYKCDDLFLYEIIEDYKNAETAEEKDKIFDAFCACVWSSPNKRRVYTKFVSFHVRKDLLSTELGQIFHTWSDIPYRHYKAMTKDENWRSILRQKINNLYTGYFDKEVVFGREYMDLLKTPKRLYYEWVSGIDMDAGTVTGIIDDAMDNAGKVKARLAAEKMSVTWQDYKKITESILKKCFDNCKLTGEYEDASKLSGSLDFITEDHFYVGYLCRCLSAEMLQFQKKYYGVRQHKTYTRCKQCGALIEKNANKRLYCETCAKQRILESKRNWRHRARGKNRDSGISP